MLKPSALKKIIENVFLPLFIFICQVNSICTMQTMPLEELANEKTVKTTSATIEEFPKALKYLEAECYLQKLITPRLTHHNYLEDVTRLADDYPKFYKELKPYIAKLEESITNDLSATLNNHFRPNKITMRSGFSPECKYIIICKDSSNKRSDHLIEVATLQEIPLNIGTYDGSFLSKDNFSINHKYLAYIAKEDNNPKKPLLRLYDLTTRKNIMDLKTHQLYGVTLLDFYNILEREQNEKSFIPSWGEIICKFDPQSKWLAVYSAYRGMGKVINLELKKITHSLKGPMIKSTNQHIELDYDKEGKFLNIELSQDAENYGPGFLESVFIELNPENKKEPEQDTQQPQIHESNINLKKRSLIQLALVHQLETIINQNKNPIRMPLSMFEVYDALPVCIKYMYNKALDTDYIQQQRLVLTMIKTFPNLDKELRIQLLEKTGLIQLGQASSTSLVSHENPEKPAKRARLG